ncbi:hypothetical protein EMEDMD4_610019 [Sinorhizobium medicae]|uniref:Uncharacterized protein n=1 Tax=Sinorhizobium medicae TaxID=110321 RepID=A0A508X3W3_9HYPH|nr:hypothetical protein EMEDMD4_610019 [Sinorhizobium medicae]
MTIVNGGRNYGRVATVLRPPIRGGAWRQIQRLLAGIHVHRFRRCIHRLSGSHSNRLRHD